MSEGERPAPTRDESATASVGPQGSPAAGGSASSDGSSPTRGSALGGDVQPPRMVEKLLERRERHKQRHKAIRAAWVVLGFVLIIGGLAIGIFPGPGPVILVPLGLAVLALEFVWAERLLERALRYFESARDSASGLSAGKKVLLGLAAGLVALAVFYGGAAWFWPLPQPLPDPLKS